MMISQGPHYIDGTLTFTVTTHRFDTGANADADAVPAYRIYENETGTAILTGNMAKLDDANTLGFYSEEITLSAANGFEAGKSYSIYITATVNSVAGAVSGSFAMAAAMPWNSAWDAEVQSEVADALGVYDPPTNAELVSEIDAVQSDIAGLNNLSAAQVNAEVDTALADIHLDHLLATTYDPASKPGASDALLNELVENDGGVARYTANALEQAPTGGSAPTAGEIADAVWEEALADHEGTAGSTAEALADAGGSGASAADIADAVWDEATAGHTTSGTFGEQVKADIDAILVDTAEIGAAGAGLTNINLPNQTMDIVGNITGNLSGSVGSVTGAVGSVTGAVGSVTGNVGGNVAGSVGSVTGAVGSVTGNIGGNVAGSVASVTAGVTLANGAVSAAALAADAVDEILDEPIGDGSITMRQVLKLLAATQGGKTSGGGGATFTIRNTADSADVVVASVDADGNRSAVTLSL